MTVFLRNPRLLLLSVLLLLVAGAAGILSIPKQEDPHIIGRFAWISTTFPGADAKRLEAVVTKPLEEEILSLPEVYRVESVSKQGASQVTVLLDESLPEEDLPARFARLRNKVDDVARTFPAGVSEPEFETDRFGAHTLILGLTWQARERPPEVILRRLALELRDRLRTLQDVEQVEVYGASQEQVQVLLDRGALVAAGLGPEDVARALRGADAKLPAGQIETDRWRMQVQLLGELDSLERIRQVPVQRGTAGQMLRVGDVAEVRMDIESPATESARIDGQPGVLVGVRARSGIDTAHWAERARALVNTFSAELPQSLKVGVLFDQSRFTGERFESLSQNLATSLLLVALVLFLMLGARPALVVAAALPLTSLMTIAILYYAGIPLHQMSVTGLIVSLGLVVDNSIVVVDGVRRRVLTGLDRVAAVRETVLRLRWPLLSSTLTTALAFVPIILMGGRTGEFVGTIGVSVVVAIMCSYAVSLTIVSAFAGFWLTEREAPDALRSRWGARFNALFEPIIAWTLGRPWLSSGCVAALALSGAALAWTLPNEFFPPSERAQLTVQVQLSESSSLKETERAVETAERLVRETPNITSQFWSLGRSAPSFYYNLVDEMRHASNFADGRLSFSSTEGLSDSAVRLQSRFDRELPQAQVLVRRVLQGPPVGAPVEFRLFGPDLDELHQLGEEYRARLARSPYITHTTASLTQGVPKIEFAADDVEARLAGLQLTDLASSLFADLNGVQAGTVFEGTQQLDILVRLADRFTRRSNDLASAYFIARPSVRDVPAVPLAALGTLHFKSELASIYRRDGERLNILRGYTEAGVLPSVALEDVRNRLAADPVPLRPPYRIETGGDEEERGKAERQLLTYAAPILVLLVATLVLTFSSFRLGALIAMVALLSGGFGLLSLRLFSFPFGFTSVMGLLGLMGAAVNDALVVVAAIRDDAQARSGDARAMRHVLVNECTSHVFATTITTCVGFLPLLLSSDGFWPPFACVFSGGILFATFIALLFVPAMYRTYALRTAPSNGA